MTRRDHAKAPSSPWCKSAGWAGERGGAGCQAPRRRQCRAIVEERQRRRRPRPAARRAGGLAPRAASTGKLLLVVLALAAAGAAGLRAQDVSLNVGELPPGKTLTITFQATVDSPVAAGVEQVFNQGSVAGNFTTVLTDDPDVGGGADPTVTDVTASPDLTIAKDDGGFVAMPGDTVTYTVTFGNDGAGATQDAGAVTITETVPIGSTFNEAASGGAGVWSCADGAPGGTVCTHAAGAIGVGVGGLTVDFAVDVDDPFPAGQTELDNTATIADVSGEEANPADNTANDTTPVLTDSDLVVEKSVDQLMPIIGETVTFTVKVTNDGPSPATGVEITDLLPSGLDYVSDNPSQGTYDDLTGVWDFGMTTLAVGAMATLEITATVNPGVGDPGGTGAFIDDFVSAGSGGLTTPEGLTFGPDGNLYVASDGTDQVLRYDGTTGAFIDVFVSAASGGLDRPRDLVFGPDGNLYVSSRSTNEVLRYDGTTGAFIDAFVSAGSGGLITPEGLTFGPDRHLYLASIGTDEVLRYDGATGAFIDAFVSTGSGGLSQPGDPAFGLDGHLYVTSQATDQVLRYDGTTGAFIDAFVAAGSGGLDIPVGLYFGPDDNLYVASFLTLEVLRYDGSTGAFIDAFVPAASGGLSNPNYLWFGPDGNLYVTSLGVASEVLRYDGFITNTAEVTALDQTDPDLTDNQASQGIDYKSADYGDAPDPLVATPGEYPTLLANDGARHVVPAGGATLFLGPVGDEPDVEADGQPAATADGDDVDGNDDENGVVFTSALVLGQPATVEVTAAAAGLLNAWIDWNLNGVWESPAEQIATDLAVVAGAQTVNFTVPATAVTSTTFARFRLDSGGGLAPTGRALDGEVEDYPTPAVQPAADLSIAKSDSPDPVIAGTALSYTVTVMNAGPSPAQNVVVTDTLPAGVTFVSTVGCMNDPAGVPACNLGNVAVGVPVQYAINVTVDSGTLGVITNQASVASSTIDPNSANNSTTQGTTVLAEADLVITKSDDVDPVVAGGTLVYTVAVQNLGPSDAQGVVVSDTLPAEVTLDSTSGCAEDPIGVPTCTLGTVVAGATGQFTVTVTVDAVLAGGVDSIVNQASVTATTPLVNTGDDSTSETTNVAAAPDLAITKDDGGVTSFPGGVVAYALEVVNNGSQGATGVEISDEVPAETTFNEAASGGAGVWSCADGAPAGTVCVHMVPGELAGGGAGTASVTFAVTVDNPVTPGVFEITNTASVADDGANGADPNPADNQGTDTTPLTLDFGDAPLPDYPTLFADDGARHVDVGGVHLGALIDAEIDGQPTPAADGDDLADLDDEDGVAFVDPLTTGTTATVEVTASVAGLLNAWIDWNANGDWGDAGDQVFTDQALAAGVNSLSVAVPADVPPGTTFARFRFDTGGGLGFTGFAADGEVEDYAVEIVAEADLELVKTDVFDPLMAGQPQTYVLTVTNNGPGVAVDVVLEDTLPAGVFFVSVEPGSPMCIETGGMLTCELEDIQPGGSLPVRFDVYVDPAVAGTITNQGSVSAATPDPDGANNAASEDTQILALVDLEMVPDVNGNGSPEVAVLESGSLGIVVRDGQTGDLIRALTFQPDFKAVALAVMPNFAGTPASELAILAVRPSDGAVRVFVRDALSGMLLRSHPFNPDFRPLHLAVVDSFTETAAAELAVLGWRSSDRRPRVQVVEGSTGTTVAAFNYPKDFFPLGLVAQPDVGQGPSQELAMIGRRATDRAVLVSAKDAATGGTAAQYHNAHTFQPRGLAVVPDFDGGGPRMAILGRRGSDGAVRVFVRNATSGALQLLYGHPLAWLPLDLETLGHYAGPVADELAVLRWRPADGDVRVSIKDASDGSFIAGRLFPAAFQPLDLEIAPNFGGTPAGELAVLGIRLSDGLRRVFLIDPANGVQVGLVTIP